MYLALLKCSCTVDSGQYLILPLLVFNSIVLLIFKNYGKINSRLKIANISGIACFKYFNCLKLFTFKAATIVKLIKDVVEILNSIT